jgi:chemotaxis protein MotA
MDKASLIGIIVGVVCLGIVFYESSHGNLLMFYSLEGVLMVFGGSISVCFIAMPMEKIKCVPGFIRRFLFHKGASTAETVQLLSTLSDKARRDGILALEAEIQQIKDPFLQNGLKMAVDGTDAGIIEQTLRMEVLAMQDRHKAGKKFFDLIKLYGPGYGLVGTLVGQVGMFGSLATADIGVLGHMLALAVVATLYGAIIANAIAGPIGDKLGYRSGEEILNKEMMLQGILSIQAGDNPRATLDKMLAFIPQANRGKLKLAA